MNKGVRQTLQILLAVALIVALLFGLWLIRAVIVYILVSAVIALIGKPVVDRLTDKKWKWVRMKRTVAAALTLFLMIAIFTGIMSAFLPPLVTEIAVLSEIDVKQLFAEVKNNVSYFEDLLKRQNIQVEDSENVFAEALHDIFNFDNISSTFQGFIGGLGNLVFALFSIVFITFFFMKEEYLFRNIVLSLVPDSYETRIVRVTPKLKRVLARYFGGLILQIAIVTTLISIGLYFIGFNNYIAIAFFAGLMNIIPYVGPLIGMAFGLVIGLTSYLTSATMGVDPLTLSLLIIGVFGTVQMIDNFVLQPIIFSNSINAHPLEIFLVISIAAVLTGITGMIVAVPAYSVIRLLAREFFPDVKFIRRLTQNLQSIDS